MAKERDNTWLQLPICPSVWRQKDVDKLVECDAENSCQLSYAHPPKHVLKMALGTLLHCFFKLQRNLNMVPVTQPFFSACLGGCVVTCFLLTHATSLSLHSASGFVVSCQSFVFATYGPDDGSISRPKCKRGEENCRYFHPPKHLALQVINMGRNNKRMKQEMLSKMKLMQQQQQTTQQFTSSALSALGGGEWPMTANPFFYPVLAMPGFAQQR